MRLIPIAQFKDHLSELVAAASRGEEIVITRHGKPAVRLIPAEDPSEVRRKAEEASRRILAHVAQMRAQGRTSTRDERRAWIDEGRR